MIATGAPVLMIVIALVYNMHIFDGYFDDECRLRLVNLKMLIQKYKLPCLFQLTELQMEICFTDSICFKFLYRSVSLDF